MLYRSHSQPLHREWVLSHYLNTLQTSSKTWGWRRWSSPLVWLLCRAVYGKHIRCTGYFGDFIMLVIKNIQHEQNRHNWAVFVWKDFLAGNLAVHWIINPSQQHFTTESWHNLWQRTTNGNHVRGLLCFWWCLPCNGPQNQCVLSYKWYIILWCLIHCLVLGPLQIISMWGFHWGFQGAGWSVVKSHCQQWEL